LGHDFSGVRIHTDAEANKLSGELQAKAFTTAQDVFFAEGAYQPDSKSGRSLIGHEMTHATVYFKGQTDFNEQLATFVGNRGAIDFLTEKISDCAEERGIPFSINRATGMFTLFFTDGPVKDYRTAKLSDTKRFAQFFIEMMEQGIYLPPSQFEAWFISLVHTQKDLDQTIEACDQAFKKI
jgi:glutamate-1-semialdehyde aminotransferase